MVVADAVDFGPGASELTSLESVEDEALLANTRIRYESGHIYTRSGRLLLAVNPYRALNELYSPARLQQYKDSLQPQAELPPHVYAVAASAYTGMLQNSHSQSVIISGESGAGKTETAKILLQYLAEVSSGSSNSDLHHRVIQTNPIMESFGCAKTVWNNNSSRFGKFLTLQFNSTGRMQGAYMKTYLLEKSRITSQLPGEQNYHVFYTVAAGLSAEKRAEWNIPPVEKLHYLNCTSSSVVWEQFPCDFKELSAAMSGIPPLLETQETCWRVLMAILHLGNATFKSASEEADAELADSSVVASAAKLLGCQPEQLEKAICSQNIKAGLDWIAKPNTTAYALNVRNALSKALYSRLFLFIVEAINSSLIFGGESRYFIGAVDIFGFECFPKNSLEQLCINFANEKLQRMFTEAVFESVIAEYKKEGIDVTDIKYEDNTQVVDLIENKESGVLPLLSEECFFPNGSDASYLSKLKQAHRKSDKFSEERMEPHAFTIEHYPGKVTYDSRGFLEKNKDPLSQDLTVLMQFSDDPFVADLFKEKAQPQIGGHGGARRFKSAKFVGVIDSFRTSLNELVKTLKETKTHFIRCVKPNMVKKPYTFIDDVMTRQLHSSGVVGAIKATRQGFPDHLKFEELLNRFRLVVPKGGNKSGVSGVKDLLLAANVDTSRYRCGKTKVFLGVGVLDALEKLRMDFIASKAVAMQVLARGYLSRKRVKQMLDERRRAEELKRLAEAKKREEEEAKRRAEEEAEREKLAAEESKKKEAEEQDRQKRFQRARQLSFERRAGRKKREEEEAKKGDGSAAAAAVATTAAAVAADGSEVAPSETYNKKLEEYQQQVAEGNVTDQDMLNVAVVSDIGWKTATGEPTQEDVWAQYDFKCAVSDVLEYAEYLGMDIKEDAHLLWIADEALQAPEPQGWEQRLDPKGGVYYYHPTTGMSLNQHPLDHHYQQFYLQMKAQYDAMYAKGETPGQNKSLPDNDEGEERVGGLVSTGSTFSATEDDAGAKKRSSWIKNPFSRPTSAKGSVEESFELAVMLERQQDGLGIGLTLDNIIVEVEPGGSVHAQGELQYGDQIVAVDGKPLGGKMLKDVIIPKKKHELIVRYSRMSSQVKSPRRDRAKKLGAQVGAAPRRIEEIDVVISREPGTGRLGFGIDPMNTVVEVDPQGPVAGQLKVGDKIVAVDDVLLNFKRFIDVVNSVDWTASHKLRIARLRGASGVPANNKGKREKEFAKTKKGARGAAPTGAPAKQQVRAGREAAPRTGMPALREVRLIKETDDTKIGAVFHRSDDAFDKSFFNVEGTSVQPIIKKVDVGSKAETAGLVPGDVVLSVNGISGLSNFQVVEMLRKGMGIFNLVVISGVYKDATGSGPR
uniref:Myosin motor domain-containing protein n=1 Tax=Chrysotila carterae TaxID=13221 RepID=A0A7S4F4P3_CHRCT